MLESGRIVFPGEREALMTEAEMLLRTQNSLGCGRSLPRDEFRTIYFDVDENECP